MLYASHALLCSCMYRILLSKYKYVCKRAEISKCSMIHQQATISRLLPVLCTYCTCTPRWWYSVGAPRYSKLLGIFRQHFHSMVYIIHSNPILSRKGGTWVRRHLQRRCTVSAFHTTGEDKRPRAAVANCERVRSRSTCRRSHGRLPRVLYVEGWLRRRSNCDRRQRKVGMLRRQQ